jgi:hypothetical protein
MLALDNTRGGSSRWPDREFPWSGGDQLRRWDLFDEPHETLARPWSRGQLHWLTGLPRGLAHGTTRAPRVDRYDRNEAIVVKADRCGARKEGTKTVR